VVGVKISGPSAPALIDTLSHELRSPLASMKSCLNVVLSGDAGPLNADQERFLGLTLRNIERLDRLVTESLDGSSCPAQAGAPADPAYDLASVLREALAMHETTARQAGLSWDASGIAAELTATVAVDRLEQIIANLASNAIKYTEPGGTVRVWLDERPGPRPEAEPPLAGHLSRRLDLPLDIAEIVFADNGVGMSATACERVFEPWYRAASGGASRIPGSGLGLHITRSLVRELDGDMGLSSQAGRGTTVWVRLPLNRASAVLVRGARLLNEHIGHWWLRNIVVLDTREVSGETLAAVHEFSNQAASSKEGALVWLGDGVVATVVSSSRTWSALWLRFWQEQALSGTAPLWQTITAPAIKSQPRQS